MQVCHRDNEYLVAFDQIDQAVWKLANTVLSQLCIYLAPCDGKVGEMIKCSSYFQEEVGAKARNLRFVILDGLT